VEGNAGIREAATRLRSGGLVGLPTETVYGLAADATNAEAVTSIFALKGRPASNPLIVHAADADSARRQARDWPEVAGRLAARFWPGPLTLVVEHTGELAPAVVAGGSTVGLRVPAHPVALALLRETGIPVAAPSANRSESVSPTTAAHVVESLGPCADDLLVLDGGPCGVGIESTVVDVTGDAPVVLRPGMVTLAQLREFEPSVRMAGEPRSGAVVRSPGQMERHYAPRARVVLVAQRDVLGFEYRVGDAVLWRTVWPGPTLARVVDPATVVQQAMPRFAQDYAAALYGALRSADQPGVSRIVVELPPAGEAWRAIHDRLRRAAAPAANP